MRTQQNNRSARSAAALVLAALLALPLAGCGSKTNPTSPTSAGYSSAVGVAAGGPSAQPDAGQPLAIIKGDSGVILTINTAKRDVGGFVTVTGTVKNTGSTPYTGTTTWRGNEEELQKNGGSLAGATLVDPVGKKRYYVLRDTEGRCLCSTGLDIIEPGASVPVFAQFPAPPATTTQVEFQVPTLPSASITISG